MACGGLCSGYRVPYAVRTFRWRQGWLSWQLLWHLHRVSRDTEYTFVSPKQHDNFKVLKLRMIVVSWTSPMNYIWAWHNPHLALSCHRKHTHHHHVPTTHPKQMSMQTIARSSLLLVLAHKSVPAFQKPMLNQSLALQNSIIRAATTITAIIRQSAEWMANRNVETKIIVGVMIPTKEIVHQRWTSTMSILCL